MNLHHLLTEHPNLHAISECFEVDGPALSSYPESVQNRLHLLPAADNALIGLAIGMAMDGSSVVVQLSSVQSLWSILPQLGEENHDSFSRAIAIRVPITPTDIIPWAALESLECDVWCPRTQHQRHGIIQSALNKKQPTIVLEPQASLRQKTGSDLTESERLLEGEDVSLFVWGDSVGTALRVANQLQNDDILVEVVALNKLSPLRCDLITQSIDKTGRPIFIDPPSQLLHHVVKKAFWRLESQPMNCRSTEADIRSAIIESLS